MKRIAYSTFEAYEVTVAMEGDVQTYAMNFLKIFNNVKGTSELIRVTNDYGNNVQVVCKKDSLDATVDFLSLFGTVTDTELVLCAQFEEDPVYDYNKYDNLVVVPYME